MIRRDGISVLNIYEIDDNLNLKTLNIKYFDSPNKEWLEFVFAHRNGTYTGEKYDLIIGPVANDDVYRTLQVYSAGLLTKEQALETLKIKKLFNQYVFTTNKSIKFLKFIKSEEI